MSVSPSVFRRTLALSLAAALVAAVGCGGKPGTLSGTVTYKGKSLKGGTVLLVSTDGGTSTSGLIQGDGTYKIEGVKSGKYKVCVETNSLRASLQTGGIPMGPPGTRPSGGKEKNEPPAGANVPEGYKMSGPPSQMNKEALARYIEIPPVYASQDQTPLTVEVKGGDQVHPITLD